MTEEEKALRDWMKDTYGGLRDDRSTMSYALEFLKTCDSNLKASQARVDLAISIQDLMVFSGYVKDIYAGLDKKVSKIQQLEKTTGISIKKEDS